MKPEPAFYACEKCGILIEVLEGDKQEFSCCGTPLKRLTANTSEGASEKHLPMVEQSGNQIRVQVGSVLHPMSQEHSITWIYLQTEKGGQKIKLSADDKPEAVFQVAEGDRAVAAYAFCNLHGFWKTQIH